MAILHHGGSQPVESNNFDALFRSEALKAYRYRSYGTPDSMFEWKHSSILLMATLTAATAIGMLQILTVPRSYSWFISSSAIGSGRDLRVWPRTKSACPSHIRVLNRTVALSGCRVLADGSQIWAVEERSNLQMLAVALDHGPHEIDGSSGRESLWQAIFVPGRGK
jgi:hypothetical protein